VNASSSSAIPPAHSRKPDSASLGGGGGGDGVDDGGSPQHGARCRVAEEEAAEREPAARRIKACGVPGQQGQGEDGKSSHY